MSLDSQGDGTSRGGASGQLHVFVFAFFFFFVGAMFSEGTELKLRGARS